MFSRLWSITIFLILLVVILFFSFNRGLLSGLFNYQPPFVPVIFSIDTNGNISIREGMSVVTAVGTFSVSTDISKSWEPKDKMFFVTIRHQANSSVVDDVYQIKAEQNEVVVMTNGSTTVAVTQHKVFVDASNGSIQSIEIKDHSSDTATTSSANGLTWTDNQLIGKTAHDEFPALAVFRDTLYMAFVDTTHGNDLQLLSSKDGVNWAAILDVGQYSKARPFLAVWRDTLWMAFVANNSSNSLLLISSKDGVTWTDNQSIGESTAADPTLVVWHDTLYMAFLANDYTYRIRIVSSNDGVNWTNSQLIRGAAGGDPIFAVWNDTLYMAYTDGVNAKDRNNLRLMSSKDGVNWTGSLNIEQASSRVPALVAWHGGLYMAFVANNSSNDLQMISSMDGVRWTANQSIGQKNLFGFGGQASPTAPALAVFHDALYVAFVANNDDHGLLLVFLHG